MKRKTRRTIVFDCETTGLLLHPQAALERQPRIIEFGAVVLEDADEVERVSILINPQQELEAVITKITGIKTEDLRDKPPFIDVVPQLWAAFKACDLMIAHNLSFDWGMMRNELRRIGITNFPFPPRGICTVELFREQWGKRPTLKALHADIMGEALAQTHRASDDVDALVDIVRKAEVWKL